MGKFHSVASVGLSSAVLLVAMSVNASAQESPRNLDREMGEESRRLQSELWAIERVQADPESARLELEEYERIMNRAERILPVEPKVEEWFERMTKAGDRCGTGVVVFGPESIPHDRFEELRLVLELRGEPSSIDCFRQHIRNSARTTSWSELGTDEGIRKVQLSIFFAPLPELRPCRTFKESEVRAYLADKGELERVLLHARWEGLKEKCAELDKDPAARSIAHQLRRVTDHIGLVNELQNRFEPDPVE